MLLHNASDLQLSDAELTYLDACRLKLILIHRFFTNHDGILKDVVGHVCGPEDLSLCNESEIRVDTYALERLLDGLSFFFRHF